MKLYATTTSERASKGQGGNEYLETVILNTEQKPIYHFIVIPDPEGYLFIKPLEQCAGIQKHHGGGYFVPFQDAMNRFIELKSKKLKMNI